MNNGSVKRPGYPYGELDAGKWAEEFRRIFGDNDDRQRERPDQATMQGWFANAIMTGYDKGRTEGYREALRDNNKHITDGSWCWCEPKITYVPPVSKIDAG